MDPYTTEQRIIIDSINRSVANFKQVHASSDQDYAQCLYVFEASSDQRFVILYWLVKNVLIQMSNVSMSILIIGCG